MRSLYWAALGLFSALLASAKVAKRCSQPPEQPDARLEVRFSRRRGFSHGERVSFSCPEDFTPRGSRFVWCLRGNWTQLTLTCEKGVDTCSPPAVNHSLKASGNMSVYQVGDNVTFTCNQGHQLNGAPQVTCGPGGRWLPRLPLCLPSTEGLDQPSPRSGGGCGKPLNIIDNHAILAEKFITKTTFWSGDRVHYLCEAGYAPARGARNRICRNGGWTPLLLICEPKHCGTAGVILNGHFTYSGVQLGAHATAICDIGYIIVGRAIRTCRQNGWSGRVPSCKAVLCEEAPEWTNAERTIIKEPPYLFKSVIGYLCPGGTLIGPKEIWCTSYGKWSSPPPKCKVITCPSPIVSSASWAGSHINLYHYRDTISIECHPGYTLIGHSHVTCGQDGHWFPGLPTCSHAHK